MLIRCPAKVNLFLSVGPRDARGYHPVRTILQAISLFDDLVVETGRSRFEVVGAELPLDNSVTKALRLAREILPIPPLAIRLTKRIPIEAGLGGGSSDAAGLLRALRAICGRASDPELSSVAEAIGVDTPFFLTGGRARGEHYGEQVSPLPDGPEQWFVLVKPSVGCPTVEMYARLDAMQREWRDWPEGDILYNDFERVAPLPCVEALSRLRDLGAVDAGLSGSGSAAFGRFGSQDAAEAAIASLNDSAWVVRSLGRAESL